MIFGHEIKIKRLKTGRNPACQKTNIAKKEEQVKQSNGLKDNLLTP
jgi:hypothetical protein